MKKKVKYAVNKYNHNNKPLLIFLAILMLITTVLYVLNIEPWLTWFGNGIICLFAILAALFFYRTSRPLKGYEKYLWRFLAIGVGLWAIAELIWAFVEVIIGVEVPYPSLADLFWLLGFPFIYAALIAEFRDLFFGEKTKMQVVILTIVFITALIGFAVLQPIMTSDASIDEKLVDFVYVLFDLVIFALTSITILLIKKPTYIIKPFYFIFLAFLLSSIFDILFFYFSWQEIYEEWPYFLIDILYFVSYFLMIVASDAREHITKRIKKALRINHFLIFVHN